MSNSSNSAASRQGLRLVGRVVAISPVSYRQPFAGKRPDGSGYDIKAHYEQTVTVLAGAYVVQAMIRYADEVPGRESAHVCELAVNSDIDVPIGAVGKRTNGVWTVYL